MNDPFVKKIISIASVLMGSLITTFGSAFLFFGSESDLICIGVIAVVIGSTLMQRMLLINPLFSILFWGLFAFSVEAWWPLIGLIASVFHGVRVLFLSGTYKMSISKMNQSLVNEFIGPMYFVYAPVGVSSFLMLISAQNFYTRNGYYDLSILSWSAVGILVIGLIKIGTLGGESCSKISPVFDQTFGDRPFDYDFRNPLNQK